MALNAKEGQEMIDACKKANVKLLVGYRMHFEPHTRLKLSGCGRQVILENSFFPGTEWLYNRRPKSMEVKQTTIRGWLADGHRNIFD